VGSTHDHGEGPHTHDHAAPAETVPAPSGEGTVLVELGGNVGAAVVTTPATLDGEEIEIRSEPGEWSGRHVAVRPRPIPGGTVYAAFFESLPAGRYVVRVRFGPPDAPEQAIDVTGARVAQAVWAGG
jgi:hypothetical protein